MMFDLKCKQCGESFRDSNPHEGFCSGVPCFREWYIANIDPSWKPMPQPRYTGKPMNILDYSEVWEYDD